MPPELFLTKTADPELNGPETCLMKGFGALDNSTYVQDMTHKYA